MYVIKIKRVAYYVTRRISKEDLDNSISNKKFGFTPTPVERKRES